MAQVRTRKDKEKAQQLRLKDVAKSNDTASVSQTYTYSNKKSSNHASATVDTLLKVDSRYIVRDLLKTVTISTLLLCAVIGIYFYLRYN